MSRYLDRRWFLAIMTVVLIAAGAVCGMWISRLVVISGDRGQMQIFSDELLDRAVEVFAEADRMLAVANSSPYSSAPTRRSCFCGIPCSAPSI